MKDINEKPVRGFRPDDEGHRQFAAQVSQYTVEDLKAMFGSQHARSDKAKEDYDLISAGLISLEGFHDLEYPIRNEDMKRYLKAALVMEADRTRKIELFYKIEVLDPNYLEEVKREANQRRKPKKKVSFAEAPQVRLFKKGSPVVETAAPTLTEEQKAVVDSVKVTFKASPPNKAAEAQGISSASFITTSENASINAYDCLQANPREVLSKTSQYGFNVLDKAPNAMRLADSSGHYIDFFKNGSAQTCEYSITDNTEAVASEMLKALLAMLNVYVVLCAQKGLNTVLPDGQWLNPEFIVVKSDPQSEKVRALLVSKLERELLHSNYDLIRERIKFDGKKLLPGLPDKNKQEAHEPCSIRFYR